MIIFCLKYLINIPHGNQNPSYFPLEGSVPISTLHFSDISPYCNAWRGSQMKMILAFLFLWRYFTTVAGDRLVFGFSDKYKVHSLFIVSRPSTKIQLIIQGLIIIMEKPIRNTCFGTVKHDWTSIVLQWTNRKHFLYTCDNKVTNYKSSWKYKVVFYNKTTSLLRHDVFIEIYQLLLIFIQCCSNEFSIGVPGS